MKTKGIQLVDDGLVLTFGRGVPDVFWNRAKHELAKAGLLDAFRQDFARERELVRAEVARGDGFSSGRAVVEATHEERLFRRWVQRLGLSVPLWPWERGWTEDLVDSYLVANVPEQRQRAAGGA